MPVDNGRGARSGCAFRELALPAALVAVGLLLRLYRLDEQSLWVDDTPSIVHLHADSPYTYHWLIAFSFAEQTPLYYYLQYYWSLLLGGGVFSARLFPALMGSLNIALYYIFIRSVFSARTALLAACILAFSPQHVFYSQELRIYTLVIFLAILSCHAFMRALPAGPHTSVRMWFWVIVNSLANASLMWTHFFCIFIPLIQGGLVLLYLFSDRRRFFMGWVCLHALLMIPWVFWFLNMPYFNDFGSYVGYGHIVSNIFARDVIAFDAILLPAWKTNPLESLPDYMRLLLAVRHLFDGALILVISLSIARAACSLFAQAQLWNAARLCLPPPSVLVRYLLFLALTLMPPFILGVANVQLGRPFWLPVYTLYSTVALYALIADGISRLPHRLIRCVAGISVFALYAYQSLIFLPETTRADYQSAAAFVEKHASTHDLALHMTPLFHDDTLRYYLKNSGLPVVHAATPQGLYETAIRHFQKSGEENTSSVWFVFETSVINSVRRFQPLLEQDLLDLGFYYERHDFPGHYNVAVYRVAPARALDLNQLDAPVQCIFGTAEWEHILMELGLLEDSDGPDPALLRGLRREIAFWPPSSNSFYASKVMRWLYHGDYALARAAAQHIVSQYPSFGLGYMTLGFSLYALDAPRSAYAAFRHAFSLHRGLERIIGPVVTALCIDNDLEAALACVERLHTIGFMYAESIETLIASKNIFR